MAKIKDMTLKSIKMNTINTKGTMQSHSLTISEWRKTNDKQQ